jgi:hypothetical protein
MSWRVVACRRNGDTFCRAHVQHGPEVGDDPEAFWHHTHSIRTVCLWCGKTSEWERVVRPLDPIMPATAPVELTR